MAIELMTSNEVERGNLALVVNPQDVEIVKQFLEESAGNRILDKISIGHIMQVLVRAKSMNIPQAKETIDAQEKEDN